MSREVTSTKAFGVDGYRSDCRNYPFNNVMFMNHPTSEKLWCGAAGCGCGDETRFQFNGFGLITASKGGYRGRINSTWASSDSTFGHTWTGRDGAPISTKECRDAKNNIRTGSYDQNAVNTNCATEQYNEVRHCSWRCPGSRV